VRYALAGPARGLTLARVTRLVLGVLGFVTAAACGSGGPGAQPAPAAVGVTPAAAAAGVGEALVQVNGVPISREELQAENVPTAGSPDAADRPSPNTQALLFAVVQKELAAQRAVALGLDQDPEYQAQLRQQQAQLAAWKRKQLAALFFRHELQSKAVVGDDEVRAYFDANRERIGTELHLLQIFLRDPTRIEAAKKALDAGRAFADVARDQTPGIPERSTPWDLGFQRFAQMPPAWLDVVYGLKRGQRSGVIKGPNERFWIVELVDERKVELGFDEVRDALRAQLQSQKLDALRRAVDSELITGAKVVYAKSALPAPADER